MYSAGTDRRTIICPHFHEIFEFIRVNKGSLDFHINDFHRRMGPGDIALVAPFNAHMGTMSLSDSTEYDCKQFSRGCFCTPSDPSKKIIDRLFSDQIGLMPFVPASNPDAAELYEIFDSLCQAYGLLQVSETPDDFAMHNFMLMAELHRLIAVLLKNFTVPASESAKRRDLRFIENVAQYIAHNYAKPISSSRVSEVFGYEPTYFCKLFKRSFGITFTDYLNQYRVWQSSFLYNTNLPLYQIAAEVGYQDYYHFTHCFKNITGITPRKFFAR